MSAQIFGIGGKHHRDVSTCGMAGEEEIFGSRNLANFRNRACSIVEKIRKTRLRKNPVIRHSDRDAQRRESLADKAVFALAPGPKCPAVKENNHREFLAA